MRADVAKTRVLIVEDEAIVQLHLQRMVSALGYEVVGTAATAAEAVATAARTRPDLVLMDIELRGDGDGVDAARGLRELYDPAVVFLTAYADENTVRRTETVGAVGYIVKPYSRNEIRAVLATALGIRQRLRSLEREGSPPLAAPAALPADLTEFHGMLGVCPAMRRLFERIHDVARLDWAVLIEGETGTGKELTARALHAESLRASRPFVAVNCAGLTESLLTSQLFGHKRGTFTGAVADQPGLFEAAHGGTLFLDEIADVSAGAQQALLRVLEDGMVQRVGDTMSRAVNVRIVSATQRDLKVDVAAGRFRADLLYRLRAVRLALPPLRERREDVSLLLASSLARAVRHTGLPVEGFSGSATARLEVYSWPGNVRELNHAVDHAVLACRRGLIGVEHLPPEIAVAPREAGPGSPGEERERIFAALQRTRGNRAEAARLLGMSRATLYRRFAALGIAPDDPVSDDDA